MSNVPTNKFRKKLPFLTPENYFGLLPERIGARIQAEDFGGQEEVPKSNPTFFVPDEYFQHLNSQILDRIRLDSFTDQEDFVRNGISENPSCEAEKELPLRLPSEYFERLELSILERIELESQNEENQSSISLLPSSIAETGMKVPATYFNELTAVIEARIESETIKEENEDSYFRDTAPLLYSLPKTVPLSVPNAYFEHFSDRLSLASPTERETPVLALKPNKTRHLLYYLGISTSVAAVLAIVFYLFRFDLTLGHSNSELANKINDKTPVLPTEVSMEEAIKQADTASVLNFDEEDIIEAVEENTDWSELTLNTQEGQNPNTEEIIDYLIDTDIDIHTINL